MKTIFLALIFIASMASAKTAEQELTELLRDTEKTNTDAVLVYKDGKMLYEYYAREFDRNTKHVSWSTAKTITAILIGIADGEGLISIHDPVKKYFPSLKNNATVLDLLNMGSGLKYKEAFEGFPKDLDVVHMMYMEGQPKGFVKYMLDNPLSETGGPGEYYNYSSGDTNLLMGILQKAINNQEKYNRYPWEKLFNPMGIDATFEQDIKGTFVGSAYLHMKPSDFLKMGQLLMNKGMWNGKQIIPPKYFEVMNTVAPGVHKKVQIGNEENKAYSTQLTTNLPIEGRGLPSNYNDLPLDTMIMYGHQGQIVAASPSEKLVIVKLATDKKILNRKVFYAAVKKFILAKNIPYRTVGSTNGIKSGVDTLDEPETTEENKQRGLAATVVAIPRFIRAFMAKEYCSCRFISGRSEAACKADMRATSPLLAKLKIKDNLVTAKFGTGLFGKKSKAEYRGKTLGCVLTEAE